VYLRLLKGSGRIKKPEWLISPVFCETVLKIYYRLIKNLHCLSETKTIKKKRPSSKPLLIIPCLAGFSRTFFRNFTKFFKSSYLARYRPFLRCERALNQPKAPESLVKFQGVFSY